MNNCSFDLSSNGLPCRTLSDSEIVCHEWHMSDLSGGLAIPLKDLAGPFDFCASMIFFYNYKSPLRFQMAWYLEFFFETVMSAVFILVGMNWFHILCYWIGCRLFPTKATLERQPWDWSGVRWGSQLCYWSNVVGIFWSQICWAA